MKDEQALSASYRFVNETQLRKASSRETDANLKYKAAQLIDSLYVLGVSCVLLCSLNQILMI